MNLQYISDSSGKTTGVFIPIKEWLQLKKQFDGLDQAEVNIPIWHISEVKRRLEEFKKEPNQVLDFDATMDEIEKSL